MHFSLRDTRVWKLARVVVLYIQPRLLQIVCYLQAFFTQASFYHFLNDSKSQRKIYLFL